MQSQIEMALGEILAAPTQTLHDIEHIQDVFRAFPQLANSQTTWVQQLRCGDWSTPGGIAETIRLARLGYLATIAAQNSAPRRRNAPQYREKIAQGHSRARGRGQRVRE